MRHSTDCAGIVAQSRGNDQIARKHLRAVNIALVNEFAFMCDRLGIEVWEVVEAAKTKPFGFMSFYSGPGLGGHCIPIDPEYLAWKLKTLNYNARFIQLRPILTWACPNTCATKLWTP